MPDEEEAEFELEQVPEIIDPLSLLLEVAN